MSHKKSTNPLVPVVFRALVFTTVIGRLSEAICGVVTSIIIGNSIGHEHLASTGLLITLDIISGMIANLISMGAMFLCAYHMGNGEEREVNGTYSLAMGIMGAVGVIVTIAYLFLAEPIVALLGGTGELAQDAVNFMHGSAWGFIPYFLSRMLLGAVTLNGSKDLAVKSTIASGTVNVVAALVAVAWLDMGIYGVGFSVSLASLTSLAVCLVHFMRPYNTLRLERPQNVGDKLVRIVRGGSTQGLTRAGLAIQSGVRNAVLLQVGGPEALVAMSITMSINTLVTSTVLSCNSTVQSMISMFFGEQDRRAIDQTVRSALKLELVVGAVWFAIIMCAPQLLCGLYGASSESAVEFGALSLRLFAISLIFTIPRQLFLCVQNSLDRPLVSLVGTFGQSVVAYVPMLLLLPNVFGLAGAYAAWPISEALVMACCVIYAKMRGARLHHLRTWSLLDDEWGNAPSVSFAIDNDEQGYDAAMSTIQDWCAKVGLDHKQAVFASHCAEELAALILGHREKDTTASGLAKRMVSKVAIPAEKTTAVEYRLTDLGDELCLRLRYAGQPYNPLAAERVAGSFELQLIDHSTSSQDYRYALDINNLILKIRK